MTTEWWTTLYDEHLAEVLLVRKDDVELQKTLRFLHTHLRLQPHARIFDQCCGIGSLAIPLAAQGFHISGCDLGQGYIARANEEAQRAGLAVDLHQADAFDYVPSEPCDAAFNWWTSFGYADSDTQNAEMLKRAFEALKPGGHFALDFMNVPGVLRSFQPEVITTRETRKGPIHLTRLSAVDLTTMTMHKRWSYRLAEGEHVEHQSRVRLYTPRELGELFLRVGFVEVRFFGGLDDEPLTLDSPRCIVVAERPA